VTPDIEGLLEVAHVGILFGVNARVREQHRKITGKRRRLVVSPLSSAHKETKSYSMKNFMVADVPEEAERREERNQLRFDHCCPKREKI
jgi:hypothetical protein